MCKMIKMIVTSIHFKAKENGFLEVGVAQFHDVAGDLFR